jgi:hypothetical protein
MLYFQRKNLRYALAKIMDVPHSDMGVREEKKLPLPGIEFPIAQPVASLLQIYLGLRIHKLRINIFA